MLGVTADLADPTVGNNVHVYAVTAHELLRDDRRWTGHPVQGSRLRGSKLSIRGGPSDPGRPGHTDSLSIARRHSPPPRPVPDRGGPALQVSSPAKFFSASKKRRIIATGTVSDPSGVRRVEFRVIGAGGWKPASVGGGLWRARVPLSGRHSTTNIAFRAVDGLGNYSLPIPRNVRLIE